MRTIVLTRIDERLIHGQVATSWLKISQPNTIVIADDLSAKNAFMSRILKAATPKDMDLKILTTADAIQYLLEDPGEEKIFMLTKTPGPLLEMIQAGVKLKEIILGNMGGAPGRKRFNKNVNASDEEVAQFKKIIESGTPIYEQMVPSDSKVDVSRLL